ncbi:MAG TPA: biotin/lipoyl-containing protein [Candidatus Thermoplasmatota archaeon]|nr:biotin/lipoyl-containing protein [Candidatus Thermoplasmatota archaeon]
MRYSFLTDGRPYSVEVEEHAAGPRFLVEGEAFQPKVERLGKGHYRVTVGNQRYEFRIQNGRVTEGVRPLELEVRRDRPVLERSRTGGRRSDGRIKPPMPGKVVEVKVKEGQEVKEGDVLLVLEAMKMQNDVKSPSNGRVGRVHVQDGATVESSTILLEIVPNA